MSQLLRTKHFDVVVIGGGSAGVAAAIAAKKSGANVLLVEAGPGLGGELVSGLPIDGCLNQRGEWIIGGVGRELLDRCYEAGGSIGPVFDWRLIWAVCLDPEMFKLVIVETIAQYKIPVLLYTFAEDVVVEKDTVKGVVVVNKNGRTLLTADVFIDCSGDGDIAVLAGGEHLVGSQGGEIQPVTLVFRMSNVDGLEYLRFVRDNPEQFILGESTAIDKSAAECAQELYAAGYPFAGLNAKPGLMLGDAIERGEMFPCTSVYVWPTSMERREVGLNTTRIADLDATDTQRLSEALATLTDQVLTCKRYMTKNVPGFQDAHLSGVAPRIGIRETRRILGEAILGDEAVISGEKTTDGVAKGGHHVDIHGAGTAQKRIPIDGGKSYDIPYGCLIPRHMSNVLMAGRCISSTRAANGSVRVMGQCMATGHAAGAAAAMASQRGWTDVRQVPVQELRQLLREQGAVLEGTH